VKIGSSTYEAYGEGGYYDGRVAMAFGTGASYVVWRPNDSAIRMRRSTNGGVTWSSSVRMATDVAGDASIAAAGSKALLVYSRFPNGGLSNSVVAARKTTDRGVTWTKARTVSSGTRATQDAMVLRADGRWRLVYAQCTKACAESGLWYRSSANGVDWSTAQRFSANRWVTLPVGLGYTTSNGRLWAAWIAMHEEQDDLTVYLRSGG
jgi:hypothetical protein